MKRLITFVFLLLTACVVFTGCENNVSPQQNELSESYQPDIEIANNTQVIGSIFHQLTNYDIDPNTQEAYISYNGSEIALDYLIKTVGMKNNGIGLMVYIDGEPQKYAISENGEYKYMHIFFFEDNIENNIKILLTPTAGKKGDKKALCIASIYYPGFEPNMKDTYGYGMYHDMLENIYTIKFNENVPEHTEIKDSFVRNISINEVVKRQEIEYANNNLNYKLYIDEYDATLGNYIKLDSTKNYIHIKFELENMPSAEYNCVFYINHIPLFCEKDQIQDESSSCIWLHDNVKTVLDAEIDISDLNEKSTFYIVIVPKEFNIEGLNELLKTSSVLLFKNNKSEIDYQKKEHFFSELEGQVRFIDDEHLIFCGNEIVMADLENKTMLARNGMENSSVNFYDFQELSVQKYQEGYIISGIQYQEKTSSTNLILLIINSHCEILDVINVEEKLGLQQRIMNYKMYASLGLVLYSTIDGLYLYDFCNKETFQFDTNGKFVIDFDLDIQNKKVYLIMQDTEAQRLLGELSLNFNDTLKIVDTNARYGKIHAFNEFLIIEEADLYNVEKEGVLFTYDYKGQLSSSKNEVIRSTSAIFFSDGGNYYATKDYDKQKGYYYHVYTTENDRLIKTIELQKSRIDGIVRSPDIYVCEENKKIMVTGLGEKDGIKGTWVFEDYLQQ